MKLLEVLYIVSLVQRNIVAFSKIKKGVYIFSLISKIKSSLPMCHVVIPQFALKFELSNLNCVVTP